MIFLTEDIEKYITTHSTVVSSPILQEIYDITYATMADPQMIVGPLEGGMLQFWVKLIGARRIIEIGTFTGYSALCMAEVMPDDGTILTCEINPKAADIAKHHWQKTPHGKKIHLVLQPAMDTLSQRIAQNESGTYDLAFIDADKANYPTYYEKCMTLLRPGGLIILDNTLWSGRVLEPQTTQDKDTRAICTVNDIVQADPRVSNILLPIRDGMMVIRKD